MNIPNAAPREALERFRLRKSNRKAITLKILVCGRAGTGKTTFINSLCQFSGAETAEPETEYHPETGVTTRNVVIKGPDGALIDLAITEMKPFATKIDNTGDASDCREFVESKFNEVLREEALVYRSRSFKDPRIHACLYFISPCSTGLAPLDVEIMKQLAQRVNVIPVIGKADTMTLQEIAQSKRAVMDDIRNLSIPIFSTDTINENATEDELFLQDIMPFAVMGSNETKKLDGKDVLCREYPWGLVRLDDEQQSDFLALRMVLFSSHLEELRDSTKYGLYEAYRAEQLMNDPKLFAKLRQINEHQREQFPHQFNGSPLPPPSSISLRSSA